jgi:FAD/FMN-containing dehydrogenase
LMLTRQGDFITLGGKFPRLTKKGAMARLKEIKKLLDPNNIMNPGKFFNP